jgi:DNA-binding CsgD family transcriptional regulator
VAQPVLVSRTEPALVGRGSELEAVERFLAEPRDGVAALALLGPPGIGKTALWQAGVDLAAANGARVLSARPTGAEASLSFAGLLDLLGPLGAGALDGLPPPQRRALAVALLLEDAGGEVVDARAVATGVTAVLRNAADEQPTVLAVDDAQWLDEATANALRFALRRLHDAPLAVLLAVRTGDGRPETIESAVDEARRDELELAPLSLAAIHAVVEGRFGRAPRRPALVRAVERSGGSVFYVLEIARELLRRGEEAVAFVPTTVQELVRGRLDDLTPAARAALLRAAALAVPTTALVSAADLLAAEEVGLVRVDGRGRIAFEHPLVAAAVYEATPLERRRLVHRELAGLVDDKEERARHLALAAAGPDEAVAAELDDAATHTAARGASAAAAELSRLALELTPADRLEERARRSLAVALHLLDAGDSTAARETLEACDPATVEGDMRARLLRDLGWILWYEGDHDRGYALVRQALAEAQDPELRGRTHGTAAWLLHDRDVARAIEHADAAVALLDPQAQPGPHSWSLLLGAYLRLLNGEGADEDAYRRGCELQARSTSWHDTSPVVGMWPLLLDDFAAARDLYERGLEQSREFGDLTSVQGTLVRLAEIACWTGDMAAADAFAAEGVELADRVGSTAFLGSALYARALVDAHLGRLSAARELGERIVGSFAETTQGVLGHWILGFVALCEGDAARADVHYSLAQRVVDSLGIREPGRFRFQPDHVEAVAELGDVDRAEALAAALEARAAVLPRPWLLATAARSRALVLAAGGDLERAAAAAGEAVVHHDRLAMPFERARTLLVQGRILRRLKQKRLARAALEEALAELERLGSAPWAGTVRAELRRVATRGAPGGLTPTERRIAELAASGLSNTQIAAQAFVSRKTVEANLARAYRKLEIASRAELGRALDRAAT